MTTTTQETNHARAQALSQYESITEMVAALDAEDNESARDAILEDALDVCVRSGWVRDKSKMEPVDYFILLCTGGPAVRIRGELSGGEPSRCWLEYQDWGTPWTQLFVDDLADYETMTQTLLAYSRQFYFGE
jgi:hypothetical protein